MHDDTEPLLLDGDAVALAHVVASLRYPQQGQHLFAHASHHGLVAERHALDHDLAPGPRAVPEVGATAALDPPRHLLDQLD